MIREAAQKLLREIRTTLAQLLREIRTTLALKMAPWLATIEPPTDPGDRIVFAAREGNVMGWPSDYAPYKTDVGWLPWSAHLNAFAAETTGMADENECLRLCNMLNHFAPAIA